MALVIGSVPHGFAADTGDRAQAVLIPLPPQNGGAVGWGQVFLSFGVDFGPARVRVAIFNDAANSWRVFTLDLSPDAGRVSVSILDGDSKVSVGRSQVDAADTGTQPIGWMVEAVLRQL